MELPTFGKNATIREQYGPAMDIDSQEDADAYFAALLVFSKDHYGKDVEEATAIHRANLGYYAGYYDNETRERVERLFKCAHPIFGAIAEKGAPSPEEAFAMGEKAGAAMRSGDTRPPPPNVPESDTDQK
jgi:hypothetical protein